MTTLTVVPTRLTSARAAQDIVRSAYQAQTATHNAWRTHVVSFLALGVAEYTAAADEANTLAKAAPIDSAKLRATIRKSKSVLLKAASAGVVVTSSMSRGAIVKATSLAAEQSASEAAAKATAAKATAAKATAAKATAAKVTAAKVTAAKAKAKPTLSSALAELIAAYGVAVVTAELEAQALSLVQAA